MNDESRLKTYQITFWINTFEDGNNVQSDSDALIKKWLNDFIQSQAQQDQSLSESKSNFTSIFSGGVDNVEMIRSINADQLKKVVDFRVGVMIRYFQLMGPEGIRLATYQLTANSESASQQMPSMGRLVMPLRKWRTRPAVQRMKTGQFQFFLIYGGNRRKVIGLMTIV